SGLPIRVPVIELIEIGAGGGSIARVDRMGLLKVGPDSAGADPGPACYNLGGRLPTVTDADLLLGYLDAEFFLGGRMRLDREAARRAIEEHVASPLGLDVIAAAWGIHRVVNENMAAAARIHGIERGRDLRSYPLFAFGGAGPVHCWQVARVLRVPRILLPFGAGAISAYGLLSAPLAFDFVRTHRERLDTADWPTLNRLFAEMESEGRALLARAGVRETDFRGARVAEMRYLGQGHEVEATVPAGALSTASLDAMTSSFESAYRALYHRLPQGVPIEALNWRVTVAGPAPDVRLSGATRIGGAVGGDATSPPTSVNKAVKTRRKAYFAEAAALPHTPGHHRYAPPPAFESEAPATSVVRESGDLSAGVFDRRGYMVAQAVTGTPGHINSMALAVKHILAACPIETLRPGDVLITNDPWKTSGHLNDVTICSPVFRGDDCVAFFASTCHTADIGGHIFSA